MKPIRSKPQLAFVRLECRRKGDAAHIGEHGLGQKAPDDCTAPLCRPHHREIHVIGRRAFEKKYNLVLWAIAARLSLKPKIYINHGRFIGLVEDEHYVLGPIRIGPRSAVHRMVELRKEALREAS